MRSRSLLLIARLASVTIVGLVAVSGLAPLWLSPYAFAALTHPAAGYDTAKAAYPIQYAMDYLWTHAELLDGPGAGDQLFIEGKRAAAVDLLRNGCVNQVAAALPTLGAVPAEVSVGNDELVEPERFEGTDRIDDLIH